MSTLYVSPQSGSALYSGDSIAVKASGTHGATTAGNNNFDDLTFGAFDSSYTGRLIKIGSQTIRKVTYVSPTRLTYNGSSMGTLSGQAWTVGGPVLLPTSFTSLSQFAGDEAHLEATDPVVRMKTQAGVDVDITVTTNSGNFTSSASTTAMICDCSTAWTADNGSTVGTSSVRKEGTLSSSITVTTTPQLRAHIACSTTNLSACRKVAFWIRTSVAQAANTLRLDLCTDSSGLAMIHSILIGFAMGANTWYIVEWDNGSALSATVNSIALNTFAGVAAGTILIDDIVAGSANSLMPGGWVTISSSLTVTGDNEVCYQVRSVNSTAHVLEYGMSLGVDQSTCPGWGGASGTYAGYIRPVYSIQALTTQFTLPVSGTEASPILWNGGYDFSSDTQTGETCWGINTATGAALMLLATWNTVERLHFRGAYVSVGSTGAAYRGGVTGQTGTNIGGVTTSGAYAVVRPYFATCGTSTQGVTFNASLTVCEGGYVAASNQNIQIQATGAIVYLTGNLTARSSAGSGVFHTVACTWEIPGGVTLDLGGYAMGGNSGSSPIMLRGAGTIISSSINGTFVGEIGRLQSTGTIPFGVNGTGYTALKVRSTSHAMTVTFGTAIGREKSFLSVGKYADTVGDMRVFTPTGTWQTDVATVNSTSGAGTRSWKATPNSFATASYPLELRLPEMIVDNTATNPSCYVERTNAAHVAGMKYMACELVGESADKSITDSGAINQFNKITLPTLTGTDSFGSFSPVIVCYGNTAPLYFDGPFGA